MSHTKNTVTLWGIWLISASFVLFQFMLQSSPSVMIAPLMQSLSINITHVGFISSSFFYPYILLQIPAGFFVDRFGAKKVLVTSLSLCSIACVLFASSHTEYTADFSRIIMGIGCSPAVVCTLYLGKTYFKASQFALVAGLLEMLGMIGGAMGEALLAFLVQTINWRSTMLICALICIGILAMVVCFLDRQKKPTLLPEDSRTETNSLYQDLLFIGKRPQLWLTGLYTGLMFTIITTFASLWAIPFMSTLYQTSIEKAATLSATLFLGVALGAPCYGILAGRLNTYKYLLIGGALFSLAFMLIIVYVPHISLSTMYILLFILGVFSASYVLPFDIIKRMTPVKTHGTAMGYTNMMCIILGAALLQPLLGYILDNMAANQNTLTVHDYQWALLPIIISVLFAFLLSFFINASKA